MFEVVKNASKLLCAKIKIVLQPHLLCQPGVQVPWQHASFAFSYEPEVLEVNCNIKIRLHVQTMYRA